MLSREELLKMREMTFEDIDPKEIQDVEKLKIDVKKSKPEKVREILESGKNPYFLKYKGITIKIGFASTNRTIEEAMQSNPALYFCSGGTEGDIGVCKNCLDPKTAAFGRRQKTGDAGKGEPEDLKH